MTLRTRRGSAVARSRMTPDIRPDTLFMAFHWGGAGSANLLTNAVLDPLSRMPESRSAPSASMASSPI